MLTRGLVAGTLLALAVSGCAAVVPAVPLVVKPADRLSIINLKTVESTVDKSLQDTVAISFVPPRAMAIEKIEYMVNGRTVATGEFDIVLETNKLKVGEHVVNLYASGDGNVVNGTTRITIIESGLEPGAENEANASGSGTGSEAAAQPTHSTGKTGSSSSTSRSKTPTPQLAGGSATAQARVAIKIRLPDE